MKEEIVNVETAVLAKEKKFDWWCSNCYKNGNVLPTNNFSKKHLFAPTQSFLQKWLREEHNLFVTVEPNSQHRNFEVLVWKLWKTGTGKMYYDFESYEKALERGLQEALTLI